MGFLAIVDLKRVAANDEYEAKGITNPSSILSFYYEKNSMSEMAFAVILSPQCYPHKITINITSKKTKKKRKNPEENSCYITKHEALYFS